MPGIFLRRGEGELVHLHGELYESEDQLQELLEANPELLLGETADSGRPSKYLLVRREAGVPQADGGSDRWFLDHLFLDAEGVPTLVEVKRSSDSRIRREVVGQMLDYAANILAYWPPERMRDEFEARCNHAGVGPAEKVREISDADYEDYWTRVKTNLAAKRLRLVFVADEIPASLQTVVEFLNEQMRAAEVLAVEVKQHKGDGVTVLTTQIIGRTSTAQHAKAVTEKREWSSESGLDEMRRSSSAETVTVAERLLSWANDRNLPVAWGSGAKIGYARVVVAGPHDSTARPFGLSTDSKLDLYPHEMRRVPPFNRDDLRLEFVRRIGAASGMPVEDNIIDQSFKSFQLSNFSQPENYKAVVAALDWFVEQTGTGAHQRLKEQAVTSKAAEERWATRRCPTCADARETASRQRRRRPPLSQTPRTERERLDRRSARLVLCRPRGHQAVAAAPVGHRVGAAVDERPGAATDVSACSWLRKPPSGRDDCRIASDAGTRGQRRRPLRVCCAGMCAYPRGVSYTKDPRVDAYVDGLPQWQQAICQRVRDLVHAADPQVQETIKRRVQPYFVLEGNICALLAAKDHINVFLYDGGIVPDPQRIITGGHDNKTARTVAIYEDEEINESALAAMFRQIVTNNRAGGWRKLKTGRANG